MIKVQKVEVAKTLIKMASHGTFVEEVPAITIGGTPENRFYKDSNLNVSYVEVYENGVITRINVINHNTDKIITIEISDDGARCNYAGFVYQIREVTGDAVVPSKFEVGKVYVAKDICYTVINRSNKFVTFEHKTAWAALSGGNDTRKTRKKFCVEDGVEVVYISGISVLKADMTLEIYEKKYNCKYVNGEFINWDWSNEIHEVENAAENREVHEVDAAENVIIAEATKNGLTAENGWELDDNNANSRWWDYRCSSLHVGINRPRRNGAISVDVDNSDGFIGEFGNYINQADNSPCYRNNHHVEFDFADFADAVKFANDVLNAYSHWQEIDALDEITCDVDAAAEVEIENARIAAENREVHEVETTVANSSTVLTEDNGWTPHTFVGGKMWSTTIGGICCGVDCYSTYTEVLAYAVNRPEILVSQYHEIKELFQQVAADYNGEFIRAQSFTVVRFSDFGCAERFALWVTGELRHRLSIATATVVEENTENTTVTGATGDSMKNQTIGVEIEFTGITREQAANVVADYFGTIAIYIGGTYLTYSVTDTKGRKWKVMRDASLDTLRKQGNTYVNTNNTDYSCELVTPILNYDDIEALQEIVRKLRKAGAKVNSSCGLHVHIGAKDFTAKQLKNLLNYVASREQIFYAALNVHEERKEYCRPADKRIIEEINTKKPQTLEAFKRIWYNDDEETHDRNHDSRYTVCNLHAFFTKGTIEFRIFNSTLHAGEIKTAIQLCLAITHFTKKASKTIYGLKTDRFKYRMTSILDRLGLKGEEFETCRQHLLKHLTNNNAATATI